jgi:hypothetical protein
LDSSKTVHIISLNIPWPADYGGVIDIFYRIRALHHAGYSIILHAFRYDREPSPELKKYCKSVFYYPRKTGLHSFLSPLPYIVKSRRSDKLLENLLSDDHPILFEGIHTCYLLAHPSLSARRKLVRVHNIEHRYYRNLAGTAHHFFDRIYFLIESFRLKRFERILKHADHILPISPAESRYFSDRYGKTQWMGAFLAFDEISPLPGKGGYILMHADLSIRQNEAAVVYALKQIAGYINSGFIIAGRKPPEALKREVRNHTNAELIDSPDDARLDGLIRNAHINLIISFNPAGFKLKLIHSLFRGRFVVTNPAVVRGTGLEDLVSTGENSDELVRIIRDLLQREFQPEMIVRRRTELEKYSAGHQIALLDKLISSQGSA